MRILGLTRLALQYTFTMAPPQQSSFGAAHPGSRRKEQPPAQAPSRRSCSCHVLPRPNRAPLARAAQQRATHCSISAFSISRFTNWRLGSLGMRASRASPPLPPASRRGCLRRGGWGGEGGRGVCRATVPTPALARPQALCLPCPAGVCAPAWLLLTPSQTFL